MGKITLFLLKRVASSDKPTENYHLTLNFPSALWCLPAHCFFFVFFFYDLQHKSLFWFISVVFSKKIKPLLTLLKATCDMIIEIKLANKEPDTVLRRWWRPKTEQKRRVNIGFICISWPESQIQKYAQNFCLLDNFLDKILIWSPDFSKELGLFPHSTTSEARRSCSCGTLLNGTIPLPKCQSSLHCGNVFPTKSWTHTYLITVILFGFKVRGDCLIVVICQQTCAVVLHERWWCSRHLHSVVC